MDQNELNTLVKELQISRDQILREEAEMELLQAFAKHNLSTKLVFYGGTALRLAYNSPRFSEDIDLLMIKKIQFIELQQFLDTFLKDKINWKLTDIKNKRKTMFALININDDKLKHNFSIKIEIHKPDNKVDIEYELATLQSPTSIFQPLLLVPTLDELKNLKVLTIKNRKKGRDIFDLWYISQKLRQPFVCPQVKIYKKREFKNELQVFLSKDYYPLIEQLYEQITKTNK